MGNTAGFAKGLVWKISASNLVLWKLEMHGLDLQMCSNGKNLETLWFNVLMCSTGSLGVGQ